MAHASQTLSASSTPSPMAAPDDLVARLSALLVDAAVQTGAAPCLIARNLNSAVAQAMTAALPALRAHGLTPLLMLAERCDPARLPRDVSVRHVTSDIASLLREQVIAGDWVWCGGSVSARADSPAATGRFFTTLSQVELRAFAMVFQGLWASGRPAPVRATQETASHGFSLRNPLAGGALTNSRR